MYYFAPMGLLCFMHNIPAPEIVPLMDALKASRAAFYVLSALMDVAPPPPPAGFSSWAELASVCDQAIKQGEQLFKDFGGRDLL